MLTNRRHFLIGAGAAAFAAAAGAAAPKDANSRIRVAVVRLGGRASSHLKCLQALSEDGIETAALCGVDAGVLGKGVEEIENKRRQKARRLRRQTIHACDVHFLCKKTRVSGDNTYGRATVASGHPT
jgi:hypothetical protein